MIDCIGCSVINGDISPPGGIIHESAFWVVTHCIADPEPLLKGLLIIQPKRHVEHLSDMRTGEMQEFGPLLRNVTAALSEVLQPPKIYACSFGDGVRHVHFLVLPRTDEMLADGSDVLREVINEGKWACSVDQAIQVASDVRSVLLERQVQAR